MSIVSGVLCSTAPCCLQPVSSQPYSIAGLIIMDALILPLSLAWNFDVSPLHSQAPAPWKGQQLLCHLSYCHCHKWFDFAARAMLVWLSLAELVVADVRYHALGLLAARHTRKLQHWLLPARLAEYETIQHCQELCNKAVNEPVFYFRL